MNIENYGIHPNWNNKNSNHIPARILSVAHERFEIVCEYGRGFAHLKKSEYYSGGELFPTTGDFVLIDWQPNGDSRIIKTLPRQTYFSRRDLKPDLVLSSYPLI